MISGNKGAGMRSRIFTTIRFKMAVFIIILLLLTASIFSLLTIQTMNRHILEEVLKRAASLCRSTAALAPYSVLSGDLLGIDNIVTKVKDVNTDVEFVAVTDADMKVLAHTDLAKRGTFLHHSPGDVLKQNEDGTRIIEVHNASGDSFEIGTPVLFQGKRIGSVVIGVNEWVLLHTRAETRQGIIVGLGITLVLGIGCILVLSSFVLRPIKELSRGVGELHEGKRSRLKVYSYDELGSLTQSFNRMAELITKQKGSLAASARELEEAYVSTVKVLAAAIDARDPYTLGHSTRVSQWAKKIGEALGLGQLELEDLEIASLFHDVGKLKTPDFVLLKEGQLSTLERHEMSVHSDHGAAILSRAKSLQKYIPAVRHHHEWYNGQGYPDGLRGDDIPLHAAIIAVADSFDAMTSSRPYKQPRTPEEALRELDRYAGRQFDPRIVAAFRELIESEPELAEQVPGIG